MTSTSNLTSILSGIARRNRPTHASAATGSDAMMLRYRALAGSNLASFERMPRPSRFNTSPVEEQADAGLDLPLLFRPADLAKLLPVAMNHVSA